MVAQPAPPRADYHPLSSRGATFIGRVLPLRCGDSSTGKVLDHTRMGSRQGVRKFVSRAPKSGERNRRYSMDLPLIEGESLYAGDPRTYTVGQLLKLWAQDQAPGWCLKRRQNINAGISHLTNISGDTLLKDFSTRTILKLKIAINSKTEFGPYWKNFLRYILNSLCEWLLLQELIAFNPCRVWKPIKIHERDLKRIHRHFSRDEISRLCQFTPPSLARWVWAACLTGLRRANLYPPTFVWGRISEDWFLTIGAREFKQGRAVRYPICKALQAILGPRGAPSDPVIPGLPHPCALGRCLKRAAKKAGLDPASMYPHNFRRTCCKWLHDAGATRDQVQELFGWSSQNVMLRYYWPEQDDVEKRNIVDRL